MESTFTLTVDWLASGEFSTIYSRLTAKRVSLLALKQEITRVSKLLNEVTQNEVEDRIC